MGMSLDLDPLELLTVALTAVMLALPISFPLAAAAIAAPRRLWNGAGLALGLGILLGVIASIAGHFLDMGGTTLVASSVTHLLGMALVVAAALFVVIRSDGSRLTAVVGILACALIGLGEPSQVLPALLGLSQSDLVVGAGTVIEALVVVVVVGALVAAAGRVRALQIGIAAAGAVAAAMIAFSVVMHLMHGTSALEASDLQGVVDLQGVGGVRSGGIPLVPQLVVIVAVLVIGTILGAVVEAVLSGRRSDLEAGRSKA